MSPSTQGRTVMVQGRIVWGIGKSLFEGKIQTEFGTQIPKRNQAGESVMQYGFGLAVPKSILADSGPGKPGEVWAAMYGEALSMFNGGQVPPAFAMKFKDGDGIDDKGRPFNQREGYAGHIVLSCTTSLPIKFFKWENGQNILISEGIKCGDYVNVQLTIKAHGAMGAGKAGLYLNPMAVQLLGYGKEIINSPDGDQIFGAGMPPLPAGASATPIAPQAGQLLVPQGPPAAYPQAPPAYQQPMVQAPPQPAQPPAPHFGVVPQQFQPPPGGVPLGNVPPPVGYPAQAATAIPSGVPTYPPTAMSVAPQGIPPYPGQR